MMTPNTQVSDLLRFAKAHQRHTEALARATGQHFNIFQILRVGHLEVKTHSPILGELLNPHGRHCQGSTFLRLFLLRFKITDFDAESKTAKMDLEYWAGPVTEKSGGRIDIVVKDGKGSTIFIENKIYAGDGEEQMRRYRGVDPKAHLFYLTLSGSEPSNLSVLEREGIQCHCISYADHILSWLKECRKEAACLPALRETISQYIHLIEELTDQSTTCMDTELIREVVKSKESLAAFFTLCDELESVRATLIEQLDGQLNQIAHVTGLKREGSLHELHKKYSSFYFTTPGLVKRDLRIGCSFDNGYYANFCYGFTKRDEHQACREEAQLLSAFKEEFQFPSEAPTAWWPAWAYWKDPFRFWRREAFEAIHSGQFADNLKAKLEKLAKIARKVCPDEATT